ncbi:MAG: hypothetical protein QXP36_02135 [Conexivisphaerales archaeon]
MIKYYLILRKDPFEMVAAINTVLRQYQLPEIKTVKEVSTIPQPFNIIPIYTSNQTNLKTTNLQKFEFLFNSNLYKKQYDNPSILVATDLAQRVLSCLNPKNVSLNILLTIIGSFIGIGVGMETNAIKSIEESNNRVQYITFLVVYAILFGAIGFFFSKSIDNYHLQKIINTMESMNILSTSSSKLVESYINYINHKHIRLLESGDLTSSVKSIFQKLFSGNEKSAIRDTAKLLDENIPVGTEANRHYKAMLKVAYNSI